MNGERGCGGGFDHVESAVVKAVCPRAMREAGRPGHRYGVGVGGGVGGRVGGGIGGRVGGRVGGKTVKGGERVMLSNQTTSWASTGPHVRWRRAATLACSQQPCSLAVGLIQCEQHETAWVKMSYLTLAHHVVFLAG